MSDRVILHSGNVPVFSGKIAEFVDKVVVHEELDPDARAFVSVAKISNPAHRAALSDFVVELKDKILWPKIKAMYPLMGGTAFSHKFNLKDPRNLDSAFRLKFYGPWVHGVNGITTNGSNTRANTFYVPGQNIVRGNEHLSFYGTSNAADIQGDPVDMGVFYGINKSSALLSRSNGVLLARLNHNALSRTTPEKRGFSLVTKSEIAISKLYKNGVYLPGPEDNADIGIENLAPIFLGALNLNGTVYGVTNQTYTFFSIGTGLTGVEVSQLYAAVQLLQTALSRQV